MSSTGDQGTGGASIIPSARRSIHSHAGCPFVYVETMGRYGVKNKREERAHTGEHNGSNDRGTDEVDNVLSKPIHRTSPFTQKNEYRRSSLNRDEQLTEDDDYILSKSLPATLPSHSYCSDNDASYYSASHGTPLVNRNTPSTVASKQMTNRNLNRSGSVSTPHKQNYSSTAQESEAKGNSRLTLPLLMLIVVALAIIVSMVNITDISKNVIYDESRFYNDIDLIGNKYNIDKNAVLRMQTGIATIFKREDTGSFMFVYNGNDNDFNQKAFNTFINDVSGTASKYLRNESTPVHFTIVEGSNLDMKGHGELLSIFRKDLDRTGVMLVKDLEAIPSTLAMAFHYYCDEYNPLVKKSAIFFTLNLAECTENKDNQSGKKTTHAVIEKCLAQKWNGVPPDSIGPLLTRVVSVLIDVTSTF